VRTSAGLSARTDKYNEARALADTERSLLDEVSILWTTDDLIDSRSLCELTRLKRETICCSSYHITRNVSAKHTSAARIWMMQCLSARPDLEIRLRSLMIASSLIWPGLEMAFLSDSNASALMPASKFEVLIVLVKVKTASGISCRTLSPATARMAPRT